jgi:isoleucyl-tRNA synthetase
VKKELLNPAIEVAVSRMQAVIQLGRTARERKTLPLKFPLATITVVNSDKQYLQDVNDLKSYIIEELNVKDVALSSDSSSVVTSAKPDFDVLGKRLRGDMGKVQKAIMSMCFFFILIFFLQK